MKRISLILLIVLIFSTMAMAQTQNFNQIGLVTQELRAEGLRINHPSLPVNSRVMVLNTVTGREVEAIVNSRIPAAANRIADVSAGIWQELDLAPDTRVRIYTAPVARARPPAAEVPAVAAAPPPEPEPEPEPAATVAAAPNGGPADPMNVTLHAYLVNPEPAAPVPVQGPTRAEPANPELNWLAWLSYMTAESRGRDMVTLPYSQQAQAQPQTQIHNHFPPGYHPHAFPPQPPAPQPVQQPPVQVHIHPANPPPPPQPEPIHVQVNPTPVQVQVQPTPVQVHQQPDPIYVQVNPTPVQVEVQPAPVTQMWSPQPESVHLLQPDTVMVQVQPAPVTQMWSAQPDSVHLLQPSPVQVQVQPAPLQVQPALTDPMHLLQPGQVQVQVQPAPVQVQPALTDPMHLLQPGQVQVQVQPAPLQVQPALTEPTHLLQPGQVQVQVQPAPLQVQPALTEPLHALQPAPVQTQVQPAPLQPAPLNADQIALASGIPPPAFDVHQHRLPDMQVTPPPVVTEVLITPGLPDPNSGKVFMLQVGSFSSPNAAANVADMLRSAGFTVREEQSGANFRVLATEVPANMVYHAAQRLGALGIRQIWVRE